MSRQLVVLAMLVAILALAPLGAQAAECSIPSHSSFAEGDYSYGYRLCNVDPPWFREHMISKFWNDFDFDKGDWDEGFGYYSRCDIERPLNRTFGALYLLLMSSPSPALSTGDFDGNFLRWAYNYAAREIDELDGRCGSGNALAKTQWGLIIDNWTKLYLPFFYNYAVPERAGTIVHEARHADWTGHNCSSCPRGGSCDGRWMDYRANTYQVIYLWWFVDSGVNTTTPMKRKAQDRADLILARGFCTPTSFRLRPIYGL